MGCRFFVGKYDEDEGFYNDFTSAKKYHAGNKGLGSRRENTNAKK